MKTDTVKPSSLDEVLQSADTCYAEGNQTGAIEALDQAAKLSERHPVILRALGTQLFLNGRHTWSRTVFEELTNAFPEEVDVPKGTGHTITLQVSHHDLTLLKKFETLPLHVTRKLTKPVTVSFHKSRSGAACSNETFGSRKLRPGP